jgi:hypothetical protein
MQRQIMPSDPPIGDSRGSVSARWGVLPGAALWPTVLRILFVLDGRISTSGEENSFGLKFVLDTLLYTLVPFWVRFEVKVVRRDNGSRRLALPSPQYPEHLNFRFTDPDFTIDDYDQIWFFGDHPSNHPGDIYDEQWSPLSDAELKILAEWMDRGGGVFATGDHFNLGASMCSRIPRVRTMRKWTESQGVPTQDGDLRNQTLQPEPGTPDEAWEGDAFPQPVELVYQARAISMLVRPLVPHPLFCAPGGVIDRFPDHMHEGEVIDDDEVELDSPLDIPGYEQPEYPFADIQTTPGEAAEVMRIGLPRPRPRPHVVAYGRTTNRVGLPTPPTPPPTQPIPLFVGRTKRFGLVSVYDGDRIGIGRVVVDSTWHHWFTYNLHGFRDYNPPVYELMQAYYRNVGLWLARPAKRQSMLFAATWGTVVSDPMAFPPSGRSIWAVGKRAIDVIGRTATQCTLYDFVATFFGGRAEEIFAVPADVDVSDPCRTCVPVDLAMRAIVGGIASSLIAPATAYFDSSGEDRRLLDPKAIVDKAIEGVELGHRALVDTIRASATATEEAVGRLAEGFRPVRPEPIAVELVSLRVIAERLQLPDPTDPALAERRLTFTLRIRLGHFPVARALIEDVEVPSAQYAGAVIQLDRALYEGVAQSGEDLVVEILTGRVGDEHVDPERLRFTDALEGAPSSWLGRHVPSRDQPWRLWYRIEQVDEKRRD